MKKFIVIYHSTPESMAQMASATPEQKAEGMKPWLAWKDKVGDHLVDFGAPLMGGIKISPDGAAAASTKEVSGYSIMQAESMEQAQSLLADHPHNAWNAGCAIEVHEAIEM